MSEWQPIKTAPKDGQTVLVAWPSSRGWEMQTAFPANIEGSVWWHETFNGEVLDRILPTHWMPLPSPPVAT